MKIEGSRKKNAYYWTVRGSCLFKGCISYLCYVKKEPSNIKKGITLRIRITGEVNHDEGEYHARQCKGDVRYELGKLAAEIGPSEAYHRLIGEMPKSDLDAGNITKCQNPGVLNMAANTYRDSQRLDKDIVGEIMLMKRVMVIEDSTSVVISGYIQRFTISPFTIHLWSEEQLKLHAPTTSLGIDATGGVVRKVPGQNKRMLHYSIVSGGEDREPALPLGEMMTNDHCTASISNFLLVLQRDYKKVKNKALQPQKVESDFSWAIIHSVLLTFDHCDISAYLTGAWDYLMNGKAFIYKTIIHICTAHMIKMMLGKLAIKDKDKRKFFAYVIARILDSTRMSDLDRLFHHLCNICIAKFDSEGVQDSLQKLNDEVMKRASEEVDSVTVEEVTSPMESRRTVYKQSPFYTHFYQIQQESAERTLSESDSQDDKNEYYNPKVIEALLRYLAYTPLITGVLLCEIDDLSHDTNALAENWFNILKNNILAKKRQLRPAEFINTLRASLKGRIRRRHLNQKRLTKDEDESSDEGKEEQRNNEYDFEGSTEVWKKTHSKGQRKKRRSYFDVPKEEPKIRKMGHSKKSASKPANTSANKRKLSEEDTSKVEENEPFQPKKKRKMRKFVFDEDKLRRCAIPYGGTFKNHKLLNTCTIDTGLQVMAYIATNERVRNFISDTSKLIQSYAALDYCINKIYQSKFDMAKGYWMELILDYHGRGKWDVHGSEYQRFVNHITDIQEYSSISKCDGTSCPRPDRESSGREILLK